MKNSIYFLSLILLAGGCSGLSNTDTSQPIQKETRDFSSLITHEGLYADLAVLSHDSLAGREAGTEGIEKAARYLAKRYSEIGLKPVGDNGTYFQHYDLIQPVIDSYTYTLFRQGEENAVHESILNSEETGGFVTLFGGNDELEGRLIFAGYGMYDETQAINQYPTPGEYKGKWLVLFVENQVTNIQRLQSVIGGADGALGAIMITEPSDIENYTQAAGARQARMGSPGGLSLAYLADQNRSASPAYNRIHPELAAEILDVENPQSLAALADQIKSNPQSFRPESLPYSFKHKPEVNRQTISDKNIVAFVEGTDPALRDEVVVLSSHYDHVGIGRPDSTGDAIYNGADDDGSGTIATLHAAMAMQAAKEAGAGPRRSVLFLSVSAEEKGLLGSRYYSDHPIYPIENTVANINIDMIGRIDPEHAQDSNYVYIIGGEIISSGLDSLTMLANSEGVNLNLSKRYNDLEDPNQFYRRSDHWNFGRLGVPFIFFFNGVHEDYHRPSDEIDKIAFDVYTKRTKLVFDLTAAIANSDERPMVDNQEFINKTRQ